MKKFKFKLQSLLEAREKQYEQSLLNVAKVQNKLQLELQQLENLNNFLLNTQNSLESLLINAETINFVQIKMHQNYIVKIQNDISLQYKIISDIEIELEDRKKEMLEANKQMKMIEKLKENDYKKFMKQLEYYEMTEIDEMTTNRYRKIS